MPASGDCELIRDGFLGQPINALSSLAFVLIGLLLMRRRPVLGWAGVAVGFGSFLYHGPMPGWAEWAHDVSLAVLPVAVVLEARPSWVVAGGGALGVLLALVPELAEPVIVGAALVAAVAVARRVRRLHPGWLALAAISLLVGATVSALSRTKAVWCEPEAILQGHAVWHVLGAGALWAWSRARKLDSLP